MKNITFILIALFSTLVMSGQSIFERYANSDDVSLVSISPKMFKMLGQMSINFDDPEAKEYMEMVSSINNFKVLISGNIEVSDEMLKWVKQQISLEDLEELMTVKDQEADVSFYVKSGKSDDHVEKLLMFVTEHSGGKNNLEINGRNIEAVLLLLEGDIDLNKILVSIYDSESIKVNKLNGQISYNTNKTPVIFNGDMIHLTNVFYNLLDNANKYTAVQPSIEITTEDIVGGIVIKVKDNGVGISKENQQKVFEKLYRVPTGNVHDVKGFGLGLSYVKAVVEKHQGSVKVKSSFGKGSVFSIYIPFNQL